MADWKPIHRMMSVNEKFPKITPQAFALWAFMLPHSDEIGVYPKNVALIKSQAAPLIGWLPMDALEKLLIELERENLIHFFDAGGKKYIVYHDHQDYSPLGVFKKVARGFHVPPENLCPCVKKSLQAMRYPPRAKAEPQSLGPDEPHPMESPRAGLIKAFRFCKIPGDAAKGAAIDELVRLGIAEERIMAAATDPGNRSMPFWQIMKSLMVKATSNGSGTSPTIKALLDRFSKESQAEEAV